jgi:hypothetical protein
MSYSTEEISATAKRNKEEEKNMARRTLSMTEQLMGVRKALKSKKTPPQFRPGLLRRKELLETQLGEQHKGKSKRKRKGSFFDGFLGP